MARVSTVGELTASLAHQLNQPLAAIKTNAQAAQRMLDGRSPDLEEVRIILRDIISDDSRAGAVIQRLRDLLRKGKTHVDRIDLCATIRDVAGLFEFEALVRNVRVSLELSEEPACVMADRVQIEQVVLNLLQNALEAATDETGRSGVVKLSCRTSNGSAIVRVSDSGGGLSADVEQRVFDTFFSTKPHGMGMGLSIARTIIEAHGGRIAVGNGVLGAVAEFSLPIAGAAART